MRWSPPQGLAGLLVSLGVSFMSAPGRSPQGAAWAPQGDEWSPSRVAATLATYDPTRIRPARGAGPHSRALVPMALGLNGTTQYLSYAGDPTGGGALVFTGWFRSDDLTAINTLFELREGTGAVWWACYVNTNGTVTARGNDGSGAYLATTTATVTAGQAFFVVASFAADSSSRSIQIVTASGASAVTTESTQTDRPVATSFTVGYATAFAGRYLVGSAAEVALYRTASFNAATSAALHAGESPLLKTLPDQPSSFWPLDAEREGADVVGGYTLTQVGTPTWTGTAVAVLRDLTGNAYHAIGWGQGMTWGGSGNARYLDFPGTAAGVLVAASPVSSEPYYLAASFSAVAAATNSALLCVRESGALDRGMLYTLDFGGAFRAYGLVSDDVGTAAVVTGAAIAESTWTTASLRKAGAASQYVSVDGVDSSEETTSVAHDALDEIYIGASSAAGAEPYEGLLGRIVVATTLTAAERKRLTRWLARPHGIATA